MMMTKRYCHTCGGLLVVMPAEVPNHAFCRHCRTTVYDNPVPATCSVVVDKQGRILLIKRKVAPKQGMWCLPGGFMAIAETPEQTALRELSEETGLTGGIDLLLGVTSVPDKRFHTIVMIGYLVKTFRGNLAPGDDAAEAGFFPYDSLPPIAFSSHDAFIRLYFSAYATHA